MLLGAITIVVDTLSHSIAIYVGYPAYLLLEYLLSVAGYVGNISWSAWSVDLGVWRTVWEIGYYTLLFFFVLLFPIEKSHKH